MYYSFYSNQEAIRCSYIFLGICTLFFHLYLVAFLFFFISFWLEDEEASLDEVLLDTVQPDVLFSMGLEKDLHSGLLYQNGILYSGHCYDMSGKNFAFIDDYVADQSLWERDILEEIYEMPANILVPNNYYVVPSKEEEDYFFFLEELMQTPGNLMLHYHSIHNSLSKSPKDTWFFRNKIWLQFKSFHKNKKRWSILPQEYPLSTAFIPVSSTLTLELEVKESVPFRLWEHLYKERIELNWLLKIYALERQRQLKSLNLLEAPMVLEQFVHRIEEKKNQWFQ